MNGQTKENSSIHAKRAVVMSVGSSSLSVSLSSGTGPGASAMPAIADRASSDSRSSSVRSVSNVRTPSKGLHLFLGLSIERTLVVAPLVSHISR